ncbi:MAG TPA: molybdate ABC transporter permease subunit [Dongiaceae bacterium]|nr:molybdate ABC transporter permease subunit [Dongiaceae bacterium]
MMDWQAFELSFLLAAVTLVILTPLSLLLAYAFVRWPFPGKTLLEAIVTFPLILPPTVLGYGLLALFGEATPLGSLYKAVTGRGLAFSFDGLVVASLIVNLPFAILPVRRAFAAIPQHIREAAASCGARPWRVLCDIDIPLALPGILTAGFMTFAHTMGEFGVVVMIGGNIPGVTRTAALAIYDKVQRFDDHGATVMALALLAISISAMVGASLFFARPFEGKSKAEIL